MTIDLISSCEDITSNESMNIIDTISTILLALSVLLVFWQIRQTYNWNKKKSAEEALTRLVTGSFMTTIDDIASEFGWSLLTGDEKYDDVISHLSEEKKYELDKKLLYIFRQLETTTIKIEHGILDEKLCFDYLFSMLTHIVKKNRGFLKMQRMLREEQRLFEHAERYAEKWDKDRLHGRKH